MKSTIRSGDSETSIRLEPGQALSVTAPPGSSAYVVDRSDMSPASTVTGTTTEFGPYDTTQNITITCSAGAVTYEAVSSSPVAVVRRADGSVYAGSAPVVTATTNPLTGEVEILDPNTGLPIELGGAAAADEGTPITFSSTGSVQNGPAKLTKIKILTGTGLSLTLHDSPNTAGGNVVFTSTGLAASSVSDIRFPNDYQLINGLYATVTGTGTFEAYFK